MAREEDERQALGDRLNAARKLAKMTLEGVAMALTAKGYKYGKAAISAWEKGRNVPDALVIRHLAKLYGTTVDALLWDNALTIEAIRFAAQFDALTDAQQRAFRGMWLGYFNEAVSDAEVDRHIKDKVPKADQVPQPPSPSKEKP